MNTPSSRWSAEGQPDPHGTYYTIPLEKTAGGHWGCDQIVEEVQASGIFGISALTVLKERIRWLSRRVEDTEQVRSERADLPYGELTDDELANAVFLEETVSLKTAAVKRMLWLESKL